MLFRGNRYVTTIRRGTALPKIVGAKSPKRTFSFTVSDPGTVTLTLARVRTGKKGKLVRSRTLPLGRYELTAVATAPGLKASRTRTLSFELKAPPKKR